MIGHRDWCFIAPPQFWGYSFPEWILYQGGVDCELRSELTNKLYILPFVICSETPGVPISLSPSPKQYSSTSDGHGKQNTSCLIKTKRALAFPPPGSSGYPERLGSIAQSTLAPRDFSEFLNILKHPRRALILFFLGKEMDVTNCLKAQMCQHSTSGDTA